MTNLKHISSSLIWLALGWLILDCSAVEWLRMRFTNNGLIELDFANLDWLFG